MDAQTRGVVKKLFFRQKRSRDAMTIQAKSFGMAIHAELFLRRRTYSMFADEIAAVYQMVVRTNAFVA